QQNRGVGLDRGGGGRGGGGGGGGRLESFSGRRTHRSVPASRSERVQVGRFPSAQQKRLDEFPSFHENHIKNDPLMTEQPGAENQEFDRITVC
uniref:Uncharacterized protein n=1 Tax=Cynoglossus semilaevis TaxID=244447 RepID=A0A3P8X3G9_CYNSE